MTKGELIDRLLLLVGEIRRAEEELMGHTARLATARRLEQEIEDCTILERRKDGTPVLDGRNADERAAQLRCRTAHERLSVAECEWKRDLAASDLRTLQAESSLLRAVARLMAAGEE